MHIKVKNKKGCVLTLISVFDVYRRARFVFIPIRDGKLVNISVFVDARMPAFDINTDETRYERLVELPKIASRNGVTRFLYTTL